MQRNTKQQLAYLTDQRNKTKTSIDLFQMLTTFDFCLTCHFLELFHAKLGPQK